MQLCYSSIAFNFLHIAKMQQHDSARETGLQFVASRNALGRVRYILNIKSSFQLYKFSLDYKGLQPGMAAQPIVIPTIINQKD